MVLRSVLVYSPNFIQPLRLFAVRLLHLAPILCCNGAGLTCSAPIVNLDAFSIADPCNAPNLSFISRAELISYCVGIGLEFCLVVFMNQSDTSTIVPSLNPHPLSKQARRLHPW